MKTSERKTGCGWDASEQRSRSESLRPTWRSGSESQPRMRRCSWRCMVNQAFREGQGVLIDGSVASWPSPLEELEQPREERREADHRARTRSVRARTKTDDRTLKSSANRRSRPKTGRPTLVPPRSRAGGRGWGGGEWAWQGDAEGGDQPNDSPPPHPRPPAEASPAEHPPRSRHPLRGEPSAPRDPRSRRSDPRPPSW